jgi:hypothetical protein
MAFVAATGRAERHIQMEIDPADGKDAVSRGSRAV